MIISNIRWILGIHRWENVVLGGLTAVITEIIGLLGGWDLWLKALILFIVCDYVSGLLAAGVEKRLNSQVGFRGIVKKIFILILVVVAYQIDLVLGLTVIRLMVIGFYLGIEGLSILENAVRCGLEVPDSLKNTLETIKTGEDRNYKK
ncbi:MAG TPA: phage holin family protein [Syntrophomonadaceae bacterium]|nr:phage holin family protein [Syntrophomonadaceae bacterium]HQD90053.1 phage holin family protein [Syntrophomonadaceae bacterium]